jgi:hypothetical protein
MYSRDISPEGEPIDPTAFLGLRLRLAYTSHCVQAPSKALGAPNDVYRGNLLYWGNRSDDQVGNEALWQRSEWAVWPNQIFWPRGGDANPKAELVSALERPTPGPVAVLYLYCQSSFGTRGDDPVLGFADPISTTTAVDTTELGMTELHDKPFVFANACTTSAADPYAANDLERRFFERGCRAFLGTETKVPIQLASRFARIFFHFFYRDASPDPMAAGEATCLARQFLWHHYLNIGGIFYSYVNLYELFLADNDEVMELRT